MQTEFPLNQCTYCTHLAGFYTDDTSPWVLYSIHIQRFILYVDAASPCCMSLRCVQKTCTFVYMYTYMYCPCTCIYMYRSMLHVLASCLSCIVPATYSCWMSMPHVHGTCPFRMLHIHFTCPCRMSMVHVHSACCIFILHVHAACPCNLCKKVYMYCPCKCTYMYRSMPHVHAACPCFMSLLHVYATRSCCMSMQHVHAACPSACPC